MAARFVAFALLLFGAEVAASFCIWNRAPTDSIRVWYSGFWVFEVGRLHYWFPLLASVVALWVVARYALGHNGLVAWSLFAAALTLGLEVLTSVVYWRSARAADLRDLFQSIWYLHRVPRASDMGWPSFQIYLWNHFVPWALILLLGTVLLALLSKTRGTQLVLRNLNKGER